MKLKGNKILITGATSGIGREMTLRFCNLGNQIIAVGRNESKLKELEEYDNRISPFKCDLNSPSEIERLLNYVKENHTDINILINNAAIQYNLEFLDKSYSYDKIEEEINTNFTAPLKLTFSLLPFLQENENAAIVNVSTGLAIVPKSTAAVYCGTKAAIHIFTKSLRYQLDNVSVFEIIPPVVDTEMTRGRGKNKISPQRLVDEFVKAFKRDRYEVNIHKVKLLRIINRISPRIAEKIINQN